MLLKVLWYCITANSYV